MTLAELATKWRARGNEYDRDGIPSAKLWWRAADELTATLRDLDSTPLSPKEAAQECALAEKTIRKMLSDGRLNNAGSPGRPKVRRGELHAAANRSVARRLHVV